MPSERRRHQLYEEVKQVLSQDSADELMSYLPPVGWADVATKDDLAMLRNEMDALRSELRGEMAELRAEMAAGFASFQRWTITTLIAMTGVLGAVVVAANHLGH